VQRAKDSCQPAPLNKLARAWRTGCPPACRLAGHDSGRSRTCSPADPSSLAVLALARNVAWWTTDLQVRASRGAVAALGACAGQLEGGWRAAWANSFRTGVEASSPAAAPGGEASPDGRDSQRNPGYDQTGADASVRPESAACSTATGELGLGAYQADHEGMTNGQFVESTGPSPMPWSPRPPRALFRVMAQAMAEP